jgi:hypothetical protein
MPRCGPGALAQPCPPSLRVTRQRLRGHGSRRDRTRFDYRPVRLRVGATTAPRITIVRLAEARDIAAVLYRGIGSLDGGAGRWPVWDGPASARTRGLAQAFRVLGY